MAFILDTGAGAIRGLFDTPLGASSIYLDKRLIKEVLLSNEAKPSVSEDSINALKNFQELIEYNGVSEISISTILDKFLDLVSEENIEKFFSLLSCNKRYLLAILFISHEGRIY